MYLLNNNDVKEIEETTFANIDMCEKDLEELIRKNINMICDPDDESMLIIGQCIPRIPQCHRYSQAPELL